MKDLFGSKWNNLVIRRTTLWNFIIGNDLMLLNFSHKFLVLSLLKCHMENSPWLYFPTLHAYFFRQKFPRKLDFCFWGVYIFFFGLPSLITRRLGQFRRVVWTLFLHLQWIPMPMLLSNYQLFRFNLVPLVWKRYYLQHAWTHLKQLRNKSLFPTKVVAYLIEDQ